MIEIEKKISYIFRDKSLLEEALTHSSYSKELMARGQAPVRTQGGHGTSGDGLTHVDQATAGTRTDRAPAVTQISQGDSPAVSHNERLEFLGDAFLDAIIGHRLFQMFPNKDEGFLSKSRAAIVCEKALVIQARKLNLGEYLKLGRGEEKTGGRNRDSVLADAVEAVIGAVYLDGGYESAQAMVLELFDELLQNAESGRFITTDYKSALQEVLQGEGIAAGKVKYIDAGESGPDHDKLFTVRLEISGVTEATATGKTKKQAQQNAAEKALARRR